MRLGKTCYTLDWGVPLHSDPILWLKASSVPPPFRTAAPSRQARDKSGLNPPHDGSCGEPTRTSQAVRTIPRVSPVSRGITRGHAGLEANWLLQRFGRGTARHAAYSPTLRRACDCTRQGPARHRMRNPWSPRSRASDSRPCLRHWPAHSKNGTRQLADLFPLGW